MVNDFADDDNLLVLAAEDFPDEEFEKYHTFSEYEDRIIRKLISHGPVLLRGGRGSGKSALLKEAFYRINKEPISNKAIGIYLSLRYLPLLRYEGKKYEKFFCNLLIDHVLRFLNGIIPEGVFQPRPEISEVHKALSDLSVRLGRRIVLYFDDAAHIGRETSLKEFFDIFRTLSSNYISCKAAIYPGVTEFGTRFDLYNDATVIDIARNEESQSFTSFFSDIIKKRYSTVLPHEAFKTIPFEQFATFVGRAVTGNVRAFVFACNYIVENVDNSVTIRDVEKMLKYLASEYYWPLLEELKPKLGSYEPLIEPAGRVAEILNHAVADTLSRLNYGPTCLVHRDHVERLRKVFEMLEYAGFIVKREASRAMKGGGRGTRYVLNLCNLIEYVTPSRLTHEMFNRWISIEKDFTELYKGSELETVGLPQILESKDLSILDSPVETLQKSKAYPYGLTDRRIEILNSGDIKTVKEIFEASDEEILALRDIGDYWLQRIRNVVGQAVWM